ncbi:hypothetical protein D3C87_1402720 [compost metagenome]
MNTNNAYELPLPLITILPPVFDQTLGFGKLSLLLGSELINELPVKTRLSSALPSAVDGARSAGREMPVAFDLPASTGDKQRMATRWSRRVLRPAAVICAAVE